MPATRGFKGGHHLLAFGVEQAVRVMTNRDVGAILLGLARRSKLQAGMRILITVMVAGAVHGDAPTAVYE